MQSRSIMLGLAVLLSICWALPTQAIPSLQLGAGSGSWTYDPLTQTWVTSDDPLELLTTANADVGGNGDYAWDTSGTSQFAYLVISAIPKITQTEPPSLFDVTVENDGGVLPLYESGNGQPPLSDPNDVKPHGIFDTYFEIYEFNFDGSVGTISNTQPGGSGTGQGFTELFDIDVISMDPIVENLHFDLFTIQGAGQLDGASMVEAFAPFSHDAETGVPEPGAGLTAMALLALGLWGWRRS